MFTYNVLYSLTSYPQQKVFIFILGYKHYFFFFVKPNLNLKDNLFHFNDLSNIIIN